MVDFFKTLMKLGCMAFFIEVGRLLAWAFASSDIAQMQTLRTIDYELSWAFIFFVAVFIVGFVGYIVCACREIRNNTKHNEKDDESD